MTTGITQHLTDTQDTIEATARTLIAAGKEAEALCFFWDGSSLHGFHVAPESEDEEATTLLAMLSATAPELAQQAWAMATSSPTPRDFVQRFYGTHLAVDAKDVALWRIRQRAQELSATACILVTEAWRVTAAPDEDLSGPILLPRHRADRIEVLIVELETATEWRALTTPIYRRIPGKADSGLLSFGPREVAGGRMDTRKGRFTRFLSPG